MSTTRGCATPVLSDDHIDLIITAAMRWHVITSRTAAAFSSSPAENHALVATAHEAGRMLRTENRAAIAWLAERGRVRPGDQAAAGSYVHCPVESLHPVEVIKAAHAAQAACHDSPAWATSSARRLLEAVVTSDTDMRTLPAGLTLFGGQHVIDHAVLFAGATISVIPLAIAFLLAQRFFVQSVATTGLK